jgi:hypothetical protein
MRDHDKHIDELLQRLEATEAELYEALRERTRTFRCDFAKERISLWRYIRRGDKRYALTAPIIYGMIVPAVILDVCVSFYQWSCFPIYGIEKVKRSDHIAIDRHKLAYLNLLQKFNCVYCGYFNGLVSYVREIAARTEQFWCPIRHAKRLKGVHGRYGRFLPYGDGERLHERWRALREELKKEREMQ